PGDQIQTSGPCDDWKDEYAGVWNPTYYRAGIVWPIAQPVGHEPDDWRIERRICSGSGRGNRACGSCERPGRLDPGNGVLVWSFWAEADQSQEPTGARRGRYV